MQVLFLDFDGVLNSHKYISTITTHMPKWPILDERTDIDPAAVELLNQLLDSLPDLRIVVSSSWRVNRTVGQLTSLLEDVGVRKGRVIDATIYRSPLGNQRGHEIQSWLDEHPDVEKFAIVDDGSDMVHLGFYLVQTTFSSGLLQNHVDRLRVMLTSMDKTEE